MSIFSLPLLFFLLLPSASLSLSLSHTLSLSLPSPIHSFIRPSHPTIVFCASSPPISITKEGIAYPDILFLHSSPRVKIDSLPSPQRAGANTQQKKLSSRYKKKSSHSRGRAMIVGRLGMLREPEEK
ncbi:MAG: hypothetical protein J3R72DRAFT_205342 [Linnemannia gamsii]|nr:MAG: hypothetical protein J3R72DRAFT_205342 [Linnemannia gamsii]